MRPITCVAGAAAIVSILAIAATAFAESPVCHTIRRGESAALAARRITGDVRNAYQTWFQIRNGSSRSVPKSQYDLVRAGWQACVMKSAMDRRPVTIASTSAPAIPQTPLTTVGAGEQELPVPADRPRTITPGDLTMMWFGAAVVVPWIGWRMVDGYLTRRQTRSIIMRHFVDRFVAEFERPLLRSAVSDRAVRSRLHWRVRPGRFDILLAPGDGRRYPNLSDHKQNVEYDVARVLHVLADESFMSGPLSMHAGWVVVPFQFKTGSRRAGVTCISSF